MTTPSDDIRRIAGTYIEDDSSAKPALLSWIQFECRMGCFSGLLAEAVKQHPENLRADLTVIDSVDLHRIKLRIPGRVLDHESSSSFQTDIHFELDPVSLKLTRL